MQKYKKKALSFYQAHRLEIIHLMNILLIYQAVLCFLSGTTINKVLLAFYVIFFIGRQVKKL